MDLIGDSLVKGDKSSVPAVSLWDGSGDNKIRILGLYFSAQWCPPCRMFTPDLINFYTNFKSTQSKFDFQVVFVSSDEDEEGFYADLVDMPWPALPFENKELKMRLSKKYKVHSIPMLILVDADQGTVITTSGRECVTDDPEGLEFPWPVKSFAGIMSGDFLMGRESVCYEKCLQGKIKALYFSAKWCPPCQEFNEVLKRVYRKLKSEDKYFEIVYISSDRSEEYFREYYVEMEMPWLALPYGDARIAEITRHFDVEGIPTFIILDENDEVLNMKGRLAVLADPEALLFPWPASPAEELSADNTTLLNESPCLILFTDEESMEEASSILLKISGDYQVQRKLNPDLPNLLFFYEGASSKEVAESVRLFAHIELYGKQLAILNIPEEQLYVHEPNVTMNEEVIRGVVDDFKNARLAFTKFNVNVNL